MTTDANCTNPMDNDILIKDITELFQELRRKTDSYKTFAEENAASQIKNLYSYLYLQDEAKGRNLSFLKTLGTNVSIENNRDHVFAKEHTLIHLKSNSVCSWIPKVGCSNIRYSIALANGAISSSKDIGWIHANNRSFRAENKELLSANYSYIFLRNPFKRLVSFYLDKLCHEDPNEVDLSYSKAQREFGTSKSTSFQDFINILWEEPGLINKNIHTRRQSDFLIYCKYDDYFSIENFSQAVKTVFDKTGLEIFDTRDINSVRTTFNLEISQQITYQTEASEIKRLILDGKKPSYENMYTDKMCKIVGILFLPDILIYLREIQNSSAEMNHWMSKIMQA